LKAALSRRELDVLTGLSQGLTREEIAEAGSVSINTVKSAITGIYQKLGAVNRADAVRIATEIGILKATSI
jgi:LuxR family maltose regulon positive regulatory protein